MKYLRWCLYLALLLFVSIPTIAYLIEGGRDLKVILPKLLSATVLLAIGLLVISGIRRLVQAIRRQPSRFRMFNPPEGSICVRISYLKANVAALVLIASTGLVGWLIWGSFHPQPFDLGIRVVPYTIFLIFAHELSNAAGWIACRVPVRSIRMGFMWELLAPYAHCTIPTSMQTYRIALVLPLITTGLVPFALGLKLGDADLIGASAFLIGGAGGDLSMLLAGIAFHRRTRVMDHPGAPAFVVLDKGNLPG